MYDRAKAAYSRITAHVGPTARIYRSAADRVMRMPDHPLRDRALLRLANSLDDIVALEEKTRQSRLRSPHRRADP